MTLPTAKTSHLFTSIGFVIFFSHVSREIKIDRSLVLNTHVVSYAYSVYNSTSVISISEVSFIIAQSSRNLNRVTLLDRIIPE